MKGAGMLLRKSPGEGGTAPKFGWGCVGYSLKRLPYFRPKYVILRTLFKSRPKIQYPISDQPRNCFSLRRCLREASNFRYYSKHTSQEKIIIKKELLLKTIPNSDQIAETLPYFRPKWSNLHPN